MCQSFSGSFSPSQAPSVLLRLLPSFSSVVGADPCTLDGLARRFARALPRSARLADERAVRRSLGRRLLQDALWLRRDACWRGRARRGWRARRRAERPVFIIVDDMTSSLGNCARWRVSINRIANLLRLLERSRERERGERERERETRACVCACVCVFVRACVRA